MTTSIAHEVFVVEDDPKIAELLLDYLRAENYGVRHFSNGREAVAAVRERPPDAIILDITLPGMGGLEVSHAIREFCAVPILMLTARIAEDDRIAGLEAGADDYVCKPFSPREVMARIGAMIRRADGRTISEPAKDQLFAIYTERQAIAWRGEFLSLSPAEYRILSTLLRQPGRVFSRDQLLDTLGTASDESSDRAIDSHVKNIRKKITRTDPDAHHITSVYGMGYRFDIDRD